MAHWCWPQFMMKHEMCSTYSTKPQIKGGGHKKIKGPAHMVEGGHHLRKAPSPHPHIFMQRVENVKQFWTVKQSRYKCRCRGWRLWKQSEIWSSLGNHCLYVPLMLRQWVSEWVIKFNGLSGDSGQWGPYKLCNHSFYIGIIIFPHIDNT